MAVGVKFPEISMGVTEGTIVNWLKAVGDRVEAGEPLVEVETAKSTIEVESPASGTIIEIISAVDDEVEVGAVIAKIKTD